MPEPEEMLRQTMRTEASNVIEDASHSSKGHWNAAASTGALHYWLGLPAAVLAAVSGGSALADQKELAGALAFLSAALAAVVTFVNAEKRSAEHKAAGDSYSALKNEARHFREIELASSNDFEQVQTRLKELFKRRDELNRASPGIPNKAFERARRGIEQGEDKYAADAAQAGTHPGR
ncbi:MAG: SLATT domain-containing protein [Phycisphaerales bacterium]